MKRIFAVVAVAALLSACSVAPEDASRILSANGITNITLTGPSLWGCGESDKFSQGFTGTGVDGRPISGIVCSGLFKNYTVRYN